MTQVRGYGPPALAAALTCAFIAVGLVGARAYFDNFWVFRGFAPPRDPAFVGTPGTLQRIAVPSPALGGRAQEAYVYLPQGYSSSSQRRYPVLYLLHGFPGRPLAFIETVQMGVVDDVFTKRRHEPVILVMPFGSTGTFTDEEWVNGVGAGNRWATFISRDLVRYVDTHYNTVASARGRALGGLSEGGYGAINIALHHPHEFSVVESWSGYQRPDKLRSIFGKQLELLPANDPQSLVRREAPLLRRLHTYIWFYSGSTDPLHNPSEYLTWVYFWAGMVIVSGLVGNLWTLFNPWTALYDLVTGGRPREPLLRLPEGLGVWPAVADEACGMRRIARALAGVVLSLLIVVAAPGWLYLIRPHASAPGPVVHDALALDELSHHGSVPLLVYLMVWGVAAVLLGLVARWLQTERVTAGVLLGVAVGGWLYALNGVSILVVRQIPAHQAFHDAAAEQALVLPAIAAGVVGALVGRKTSGGAPRSRIAFAWFVTVTLALATAAPLLSTTLPSSDPWLPSCA